MAGAVGSVTGLTASNLDATISSRMATYTQPTGFLAATFPTTVASTTNITAGTITTVSGNVTGSIGSLATQAKADVNAEADAALSDVGLTTTITGRIDVTTSTRLASTSYTAPLDAAGTRTAVGLATANLDTQIGDLPTNAELATALAGADDAVLSAVAALSIPTATQNADALLDRAAGVETNRTLRQALRLMLAALCGKASGLAGTSVAYRDTNDTTNRISATVDSDGNRTAVTLDAS